MARAANISFVIYFSEDCSKGIFGAGTQSDLRCNVVNGIPTMTYNPAAETGNNFITPGDVILTEAGVGPFDPNINSDILRFSRLAPNDPKGARQVQFLSDDEEELFGTVGAPKVIPEVDLSTLKPIATTGGVVGPFDGSNKKFPDLRGTVGALYIAGVGDIGGPTSNSIAYIFVSDEPPGGAPEPSSAVVVPAALVVGYLVQRHRRMRQRGGPATSDGLPSV